MSVYHDLKEVAHDAYSAGEWLYDHVLHHVDEHFQPGSGDLGEAYRDFINEFGDAMTLFENHHPVDHSQDYHYDRSQDHCNY